MVYVSLSLDRLAKLNSKMQDADAEKGRVLAEAQECQLKLDLAERLVNGLADENTRWTESVLQLENSRITVIGDTMLASAFVSYVGAFTSPFRVSLIEVRKKRMEAKTTGTRGQAHPCHSVALSWSVSVSLCVSLAQIPAKSPEGGLQEWCTYTASGPVHLKARQTTCIFVPPKPKTDTRAATFV